MEEQEPLEGRGKLSEGREEAKKYDHLLCKARRPRTLHISPKIRIMNCNGLGYDLQLDFSKLLQESRKHTNDAAVAQLESAKMRSTTKKKKTWIRTLSLLFKFREKKSGAEEEAAAAAAASKAKSLRLSGAEQKPSRSGPLFGNSRRFGQLHEKMGLSSSGPLSSCFTPTRAEETEAPYSCLGHQNQAFGPIYLVT